MEHAVNMTEKARISTTCIIKFPPNEELLPRSQILCAVSGCRTKKIKKLKFASCDDELTIPMYLAISTQLKA